MLVLSPVLAAFVEVDVLLLFDVVLLLLLSFLSPLPVESAASGLTILAAVSLVVVGLMPALQFAE